MLEDELMNTENEEKNASNTFILYLWWSVMRLLGYQKGIYLADGRLLNKA